MENKKMIPCLYLASGKAVTGFGQRNLFCDGDVEKLARMYRDHGADEILVFDFSSDEKEHEDAISRIRTICRASELPVMAAGNINCMEDIKKLIGAGCAKITLNFSKQNNVELLEEMSTYFGREKIYVCISEAEEFTAHKELIEKFAGGVLALDSVQDTVNKDSSMKVILHTEESKTDKLFEILKHPAVCGLSGAFISSSNTEIYSFKDACTQEGIPVKIYESAIAWSEFRLNEEGLIPVVVQDHRTKEVLMMSYMNEEAFQRTLRTRKMTYWDNKRKELYVKDALSDGFQYVNALTLNCDNDTILASVVQSGVTDHRENKSSFVKPLVKKENGDKDFLRVFQDTYDMLVEKRFHQKEDFTDSFLEKDSDKILKKLGEDCMEIIIAAKDPNRNEIRQEISTLVYHIMVLMAEKGVTWDEITRELLKR